MKIIKHEWQCAHAELIECGQGVRFSCALKQTFKQKFRSVQRGCFGNECMHNRENSDEPSYIKKYINCPLARSVNGDCECINGDGSSKFCHFGEREFINQPETECLTYKFHNILGCTFGRMMTDEEFLLVADRYLKDNWRYCCRIFGKSKMFQKWFADMLKFIGCPKELYSYGYKIKLLTNVKKEDEQSIRSENAKHVNEVIRMWDDFRNKRMAELKKESK